MNKDKFLYFSQADLLAAGCFDLPMAIEVTEEALRSFHAKQVLCPEKIIQIFDDVSQSRINCLPATLLDRSVCGMKWVSVFPDNPKALGLPNVSAVILLSDIRNGSPVALLEGTVCSNLRTAAISAVAAKHLAKKGAEQISLIGAGEQAKAHFAALKAVLPSLKKCHVSSRTEMSCERFVSELAPHFPDVAFKALSNRFHDCVRGGDVIVTATSGQDPILQADWIEPGALYCHVGGWEDGLEVPLQADKIVCDCWESAKARTQTISRLFREGRIVDSDIHGDLHQVVCGQIEGRSNDCEFIYFNVVGLAYVDVLLACSMAERAAGAGFGLELPRKQMSLFDQGVVENVVF